MKLKKILTLLLTLMTLVGLSACATSSARGEDITFDENGNLLESSGTTLHIWGYCDGGERNRMFELVTAFNNKYEKYNIKAKFTPYDSSGWEQKMKATLSSSTGPDVFLTSDEYYKQWATLGFMENLDPYISSDISTLNMEEDLAKMFEGGVGRYHYDVETTTSTSENAHYYGLPKGTGSTAIYYNKTHLKNAKITEISIYEEDMDAYNAQNGTTYPKKAYFKHTDGKWYFNNKIAMNWEECAELATKLQNNSINKQAGLKYGFLTSWWFNYGYTVGGDCIEYLPTDDAAYTGGYYTFTLADSTVNYKAKETIIVNGNVYEAGTIVSYEDKFYLDDELASSCDVLPSQRQAFTEYLSLAGKLNSDHYYSGESGLTDRFWEIIPYRLNGGGADGIAKNTEIMKNQVTSYVPSAEERYGSEQVSIYNKGISPNPSTFKTDGRIQYFANGYCSMVVEVRSSVQSCRDSIRDFEWDVAPMLEYREYDENNNLITSGVKGAHSGSTSWCVWSKSTIKNAAYLFVKFATTEEGQRILANAGTIIPNQRDIAYEMVAQDVAAGKSPSNLEIFIAGAEYQTPGDWWYLKDGDWIDTEGGWANYLNSSVRNYTATLSKFYSTKDYYGTFEKLLEYTKRK